jgi:hypothetical protein
VRLPRFWDFLVRLDEFRLTRDSQMAEVFRLAMEHGDVTMGGPHAHAPSPLALLAPA